MGVGLATGRMLEQEEAGEEVSPSLRQRALQRLEEQVKPQTIQQSPRGRRDQIRVWCVGRCIIKPGCKARHLRSRNLKGHTGKLGINTASGMGTEKPVSRDCSPQPSAPPAALLCLLCLPSLCKASSTAKTKQASIAGLLHCD